MAQKTSIDSPESIPKSLRQHFSHSLYFDWVLYPYEIKVNEAYSLMLAHISIITSQECSKIRTALNEINKEINEGKFRFKIDQEDIHTAIEDGLTEKLGELAQKITVGRSKYDMISMDLRLWTWYRKKVSVHRGSS